MPTPDPALALRGVNTYYGKSHAVRDITFEIADREVVAILGRNGAGKTTTINTIAGLLTARSGTISVGGVDVTHAPPHRRVRAGLGLVPSSGRLFRSLSVLENLEIARRGKSEHGWTVDRVFSVFPRLAQFPGRAAGALSGGERQMLAVGRALMTNPSVLLLDEPSEGLAPVIIDTLADVISTLRSEGVTMLLCEQNLWLATEVADRAYLLEKGELSEVGSLRNLTADEAWSLLFAEGVR